MDCVERLPSREWLLERIAGFDEEIAALQARLVATQQREGRPPVEDLEQTLRNLIEARAVLHQRLKRLDRPGLHRT
jgi:hypothetical protein